MKAIHINIILLVAGIGLLSNPIYSQRKIEASVGFGIPELFNAGIKYGENLQFGVCAGFVRGRIFNEQFTDWSVAAEIYYHFADQSIDVKQAPWYVLAGFGHYNLAVFNRYELFDFAFYPRIGRTCNFSKQTGMNLDVGFLIPVSKVAGYES